MSLSEMGLLGCQGDASTQEGPSGLEWWRERSTPSRQDKQERLGKRRGNNNGEEIYFLGHYIALTNIILVHVKELGH